MNTEKTAEKNVTALELNGAVGRILKELDKLPPGVRVEVLDMASGLLRAEQSVAIAAADNGPLLMGVAADGKGKETESQSSAGQRSGG